VRKGTYRAIIDELWWFVYDVYEPDRYDLSDDLIEQADKLLNSLVLEDQMLLVEYMRGTILNSVEMLNLELWAAGKAEEKAQTLRKTPPPLITGKDAG